MFRLGRNFGVDREALSSNDTNKGKTIVVKFLKTKVMFWNRQNKPQIHLIGIGGSGMSGIAEVLLGSGFAVTGSDLHSTAVTDRLEQMGAGVRMGHRRENLEEPSCVVVSSAVSPDNPECLEADRRGIPVIPRAEMLAELMRLKRGVAVAGSHGKTTSTSLLGQFLRPLDPTVVVGGIVQHWNASSRVGKSSLFVVEADESDRSFLHYSPVYSLVTNIDWEHVDAYRDLEDLKDSFVEFLNRTAFFGENWINVDCEILASLRARLTKPTKTFGFRQEADLCIESYELGRESSRFSLNYQGESWGEFELPLVGKHNISNAVGAMGLAWSLGVGLQSLKRRARNLQPVKRRLQLHACSDYGAVVEDYAHHPTEISAALESLRLSYPHLRKLVVFQPHRYSRTAALSEEFARCFQRSVDDLVLFPVYAAHEDPIAGVDSAYLKRQMPGSKPNVHVFSETPTEGGFLEKLEELWVEPTLVVILGAAPLTHYAVAASEFLHRQEGQPVFQS